VPLSESEIRFRTEGSIAWITFDRPQAHNAMTWAMYEGLYEYCDRIDQDPDIRVAVLRGAGGKAFVAGTDISQFQSFREPKDGIEYEAHIDRIVGRLECVKKPTIALIEGFAVGGGAALAMACDLRYATPDLKFGVPVARTLGNCLSLSNYSRLVSLVGPARTKEIIFLARMVEAPEALSLGLVNEITPADSIEARVREVADTLTQHAPLTLWATKEALRRMASKSRLAGADGEDLIVACYTSEDFRNAVVAFLEKRNPVWKGN
jgi:enoyl-CoA hydratase/carnithine racemase